MASRTTTSGNQRSAGEFDLRLGARLRCERTARGISRSVLARRLGVSHQQLQKYEAGLDRVTVGRFVEIAAALDVSIEVLLAGLGPGGVSAPPMSALQGLLAEPGAIELLGFFASLKDIGTRRRVLDIVCALSVEEA